MQRFFVLNENTLCATEGKPEFTVCSQTPLTTCSMTVLAVKDWGLLVEGQETLPMPEWTIRLATTHDLSLFDLPECYHAAILQQETETAMNVVAARDLVTTLCAQAAALIEDAQNSSKGLGLVNSLEGLGSLICRSEQTAADFEQVYNCTEWMFPIIELGLLRIDIPCIAVVVDGIRELLTIPMDNGMPEAVVEVEALRNVKGDELIKQALLAYDGVRLAHQLALNMQGHVDEVKQIKAQLTKTLWQKTRLSYDIKLLVERLQATDESYTVTVPDLDLSRERQDWQCVVMLEYMLTEAVRYHNEQRSNLLEGY